MAKTVKKQKAARPAAKKSVAEKSKKTVKPTAIAKSTKSVKAVKTVKTAKTTTNKPATELNFIQLIKDAGIVAAKQTDALKKSIVDLKAKLAKATAKQKTQKDKRATVANKFKTNPSPASKNQLNKAKEEYTTTTELLASLKAEFETAKNALQIAQTEQSKLTALQKLLSSFEKDWKAAQKQKTATPTTKVVASAPKKAAPKKAVAKTKDTKSSTSTATKAPASTKKVAPKSKETAQETTVASLSTPQFSTDASTVTSLTLNTSATAEV